MTDEQKKDAPPAEAAQEPQGAEGGDPAEPAEQPFVATAAVTPAVLPEAAKPPRRTSRAKQRTLTYGGPADAFTYTSQDGTITKFRPGVPTQVAAADADELLTYPRHRFSEADASQDAQEAQEQDNGDR